MPRSPKILSLTSLLLSLAAFQAHAQLERVERNVSGSERGNLSGRSVTATDIRNFGFGNLSGFGVSLGDLNSSASLGMEALNTRLAGGYNNILDNLEQHLSTQDLLKLQAAAVNNPGVAADLTLGKTLVESAFNPEEAYRFTQKLPLGHALSDSISDQLHAQAVQLLNAAKANPALMNRLQSLRAQMQNFDDVKAATLYDGQASGRAAFAPETAYNPNGVTARVALAAYVNEGPAPAYLAPIGLHRSNVPVAKASADEPEVLPTKTISVSDPNKVFGQIWVESVHESAFHNVAQALSRQYRFNQALALHVDPTKPPQLLQLVYPGVNWLAAPHGLTLNLEGPDRRTLSVMIVSAPRNSTPELLEQLVTHTIEHNTTRRNALLPEVQDAPASLQRNPLQKASSQAESAPLPLVANATLTMGTDAAKTAFGVPAVLSEVSRGTTRFADRAASTLDSWYDLFFHTHHTRGRQSATPIPVQ